MVFVGLLKLKPKSESNSPNTPSLRVSLVGGVKKWENRKYLVFSRVCLVGEIKKWEGGKLFYLVKKKSERIENVVYIN